MRCFYSVWSLTKLPRRSPDFVSSPSSLPFTEILTVHTYSHDRPFRCNTRALTYLCVCVCSLCFSSEGSVSSIWSVQTCQPATEPPVRGIVLWPTPTHTHTHTHTHKYALILSHLIPLCSAGRQPPDRQRVCLLLPPRLSLIVVVCESYLQACQEEYN